jgi:hypothetical protein
MVRVGASCVVQVAAVQLWLKSWHTQAENKTKMSLREQLNQQSKEAKGLASELAHVKSELAEARQAMMEGRGHEVENRSSHSALLPLYSVPSAH